MGRISGALVVLGVALLVCFMPMHGSGISSIPTDVMRTDAKNVMTSLSTLDASLMSVNEYRLPKAAALVPTTDATIGFDTTGLNYVGSESSAGVIIPAFTITPVNGNCATWVVSSTNYKLGQVTCPTSPTSNQGIRTIGASFGSFQSGASALSAGATSCVPTYFSGTISAVEIIGNVSGSATIDVQTVAHASWTGTASVSSITASDIPALSSASSYTDTTLTGWTKSLSAGTDVCFVMTSPSTVAGLSITVKVQAN